MHRANHPDVDARINHFLSKKTVRSDLSHIITDWLLDGKGSARPIKAGRFELLPIRPRR